jgi:hypothetical protein
VLARFEPPMGLADFAEAKALLIEQRFDRS